MKTNLQILKLEAKVNFFLFELQTVSFLSFLSLKFNYFRPLTTNDFLLSLSNVCVQCIDEVSLNLLEQKLFFFIPFLSLFLFLPFYPCALFIHSYWQYTVLLSCLYNSNSLERYVTQPPRAIVCYLMLYTLCISSLCTRSITQFINQSVVPFIVVLPSRLCANCSCNKNPTDNGFWDAYKILPSSW